MTPTHRQGAIIVLALLAPLATACGNSPSGPSNQSTSRLAGTWRGDLFVTKTGQPEARSATEWTFSSAGGPTAFQTAITATTPILTDRIQAATTVIAPGSTLPVEVVTTGTFLCPGAAPAPFGSAGLLTDERHIEATFHGVDCAGSPFDGHVALTR